MLMRFAFAGIVGLLLTLPAQALPCNVVDASETQIRIATTKAAIARELVRLGAPQADADNLMHASPDLDAARENAIRAMRLIRASCTR